MRIFLVILCGLLTAGLVSAQGVYNMAKQEAKNVANGAPPQGNGSPPMAANPAPAPPDPVLQATMRNVNNLRVDFENFGANPTNTVSLTKDLTEAAQGAKPSPESINRLAQSLAAAVAGNKKLQPQHQKLAQYVHALFNASHLQGGRQQTVLDAVKKILSDGGVPADDVTKVLDDLNAIATQTR